MEEFSKRLAMRIKELRSESGLTQASFANEISMSRSELAEIETAHRNASSKMVARIAGGLGITIRDFYDSPLFDFVPELSLKEN